MLCVQVRKDVEPLERSQEEDVRRFAQYCVPYDTTTMASVKEAVVKMSARLLAHTLNVRFLLPFRTYGLIKCVRGLARYLKDMAWKGQCPLRAFWTRLDISSAWRHLAWYTKPHGVVH